MDMRVARTRRRLQEALFELASERRLDVITIGDIAAAAGVNRATFYEHYSDKETLLADALALKAAEADADLKAMPHAEPLPFALEKFLEHVRDHADVYQRVLEAPGHGAALAGLRSRILEGVRGLAGADEEEGSDLPPRIAAAGVMGMMIGVIAEWLGMEDRPPARAAADWIWQIARAVASPTGRV